jgi:uncharacterized protein (TIRG00374 family)
MPQPLSAAAPGNATPRRPHPLLTLLRAGLGLGLAAWLLYRLVRDSGRTGTELLQAFGRADHALLAAAFLVYGLVIGITVLRWGLLLRVQGVHLGGRTLGRLTLIGVFFSLMIPGANGGDLVKAGYLAAEAGNRRTEAILTIVLDRVMGLLGLLIVASAAVWTAYPMLQRLGRETPHLRTAALAVGTASVLGLLGVLVFELHPYLLRIPGLGTAAAACERRVPRAVAATVRRLGTALALYRNHRLTLVSCLALAIAVHTLLALEIALLAAAFGERSLALGDHFVAAQVANAIAAVPLTGAGIGVRDVVLEAFYRAWDCRADVVALVPLAYTFTAVAWSLVGGVVFVRGKRRAGPGPETPGTGARA